MASISNMLHAHFGLGVKDVICWGMELNHRISELDLLMEQEGPDSE
jgi:hypothetical protein